MTFYTEYAEKWEKAVENAQILDAELQAPEYENAILLPLRKRADSPSSSFDGWHEGGVCAADYTFIAGLDRKTPRKDANFACVKSYIPDSVKYRDETVIFGGVLIDHFGHNLVDCLSRMWYFAKNPDTPHKFVFLMMTGHTQYTKAFFELAGLTEDRYEIITEATQFRSVIVPDEAMYSISSTAHPHWLLFFERIKENIRKTTPKSLVDKVYLTRTQLPPEVVIEFNECYYENFFSERGYTVVAPEKLPLSEQINIIMNASSIVATMGTLSHMMVFANENTNCTFLLRSPSEIVRPQIIIDRLKGYGLSYVEVTRQLLPSPHAGGIPFYSPTPYFSEYVSDNQMRSNEVEDMTCDEELVLEYLRKYALYYRNSDTFRRIANYTAFDFVNSMNHSLYGITLDKENYQKPKVVQDNERLKNEKKKLENQLTELKNSTSWKITKPLRLIAKVFRRFKKKVKSCLKH